MTADLDTGFRPLSRDATASETSRQTGRRPTVGATTADPAGARRPSVIEVEASRLRAFYANRSSRLTLAITSVMLCYGGGGAMFWLHAIVRGEQGPAISAPYHWLLDSTLGFIALSPILFFLIPTAHRTLRRRLHPLAVGAAFALVTTPGPVIHDKAVGGGTPLAQLATNIFGRDLGVAARNVHAVSHSATSECLLQLAVGLPVYGLLTGAAFALSTTVVGRCSARAVRTRQLPDRQELVGVSAASAA